MSSFNAASVSPALDHEVQDLAFIVDRAPKIHPLSADPADHLVQVPARRRGPSPLLKPPGDQRAEPDRPAADRLVADVHTAGRHQFLNVTKTEAETKVQPDGMADNICRKPVTLERNRLHEISSPSVVYATNTGDLLSFA